VQTNTQLHIYGTCSVWWSLVSWTIANTSIGHFKWPRFGFSLAFGHLRFYRFSFAIDLSLCVGIDNAVIKVEIANTKLICTLVCRICEWLSEMIGFGWVWRLTVAWVKIILKVVDFHEFYNFVFYYFLI
jgi:hypothetical protein